MTTLHLHTVFAVLIAITAGAAWGVGREIPIVVFGMYVLVDHTLATHRREDT